MAHSLSPATRWLLLSAAALLPLAAATIGQAQVFGPPSTVWGSVTDSAGPVPEGLTIEAYVGDTLCGKGKTQFTGDGEARVTAYFADVVSKEQTAGCGFTNAEVRIKVGDRFAPQTAKWNAGPVELNLAFNNATPVAVPTFTPAPTRTPAPPKQEPTQAVGAGASGQDGGRGGDGGGTTGTIAAGTPGAGSPIPGGITTNPVNASATDSGDGGFPVWGAVLIGLVGLAIVGGGVGLAITRNRRAPEPAIPSEDF